jgi:hypothetical protein
MGARITRLDVEALTLEARLTRWRLELVLRVQGAATGSGGTRLAVQCAGAPPGLAFGLGRLAIARFRATLAGTEPPPLERR